MKSLSMTCHRATDLNLHKRLALAFFMCALIALLPKTTNAQPQHLDNQQLAQIYGRGFEIPRITAIDQDPRNGFALTHQAYQADQEEIDVLIDMLKNRQPILHFIEADRVIQGVTYAADRPRYELLEDGVRLALPQTIERIEFNSIRILGGSQSLGSLTLSNLRFSEDAQVRVRAR